MKLRVFLALLFSAILLGCLGYQQGVNVTRTTSESMYIYHVRGVPTAIVVYNDTVTVLTGSNKVLELEDIIRCIKECWS